MAPGDRRDVGSVLDSVVEQLCDPKCGVNRSEMRNPGYHLVPSRNALAEMVEALRAVFFPGFFGTSELSEASLRFHFGATVDRVRRIMREQITKALAFENGGSPRPHADKIGQAYSLTTDFIERLPEIRRLLATDVAAAYEGDPAATCIDEVVICYPGMLAITNHRLAHELYRLDVPILPRIISELSHGCTGIDIHPGASIGERFFIDHGTGVVIGETCVIGQRVRIYQGVTLGAKSFPKDKDGNPIKGIPRHPMVEDDVIVYGGATILGRIVIGRGSVIGGNIWLTQSVPPGSRVTQAHNRQDLFSQGGGI
jgi:serine O-acetyltransferase